MRITSISTTRPLGGEAPFYEEASRQYSTYVPHDVAGLIGGLGGDAAFASWLDRLFGTAAAAGGYGRGNEPDFLAAYPYVHAGSATSPERRYVVAARLNGIPIDRAWISH